MAWGTGSLPALGGVPPEGRICQGLIIRNIPGARGKAGVISILRNPEGLEGRTRPREKGKISGKEKEAGHCLQMKQGRRNLGQISPFFYVILFRI